MTFVGRVVGPRREAAVAKVQSSGANWLADLLGGKSHTGKLVTLESALKLDTIIACVGLLSETVGGFPLKVYQGDPDDEREAVPEHPTYELLHSRPNPAMPPVTFWGLVMMHCATWGESFIGKRFSPRGQVNQLWAVEPGRVRVELREGEKLYWVKNEDGVERDAPYTADEIIHVIGFTRTGLRGLSPVEMAREAIGAGLAIDEYTNRFFANGAIPLGVLETDNELTDDAHGRLRRDWERRHKGPQRAHRIAILEQGLKYHAISMPLKDLEFVALQALSAKKICRIYRTPASMIDAEGGDQGKGLTYRNVQADNIRFLVHTIRVWLKRISQSLEMDRDLFPEGSGLFAQHVVADLLQMDPLTEAQVFAIETGNRPWRQPNEVRRLKNLPAIPELDELPAQAAASTTEPGAAAGAGSE